MSEELKRYPRAVASPPYPHGYPDVEGESPPTEPTTTTESVEAQEQEAETEPCRHHAPVEIGQTGKYAYLHCELPSTHEGPHSYEVEEDYRLTPAELSDHLNKAYYAGWEVDHASMTRKLQDAAAELRQYWATKPCGAILQVPALNASGEPIAINVGCSLLAEHDGDHSWHNLTLLLSGTPIPTAGEGDTRVSDALAEQIDHDAERRDAREKEGKRCYFCKLSFATGEVVGYGMMSDVGMIYHHQHCLERAALEDPLLGVEPVDVKEAAHV